MRNFFRRPEQTAPVVVEMRPAPMSVRSDVAMDTTAMPRRQHPRMPQVPERVIPGAVKMAVDADMAAYYASGAANGSISEGVAFQGYPFLAELAQRPEYRRASEIVAMEMTRKWGRIVSTGDEEEADRKTDRIKQISAELARLGAQKVFRKVALHDGLFGRGQIFVEMDGGRTPPEELEKPLLLTKAKLGDGITALRTIEPVWTYPAEYNSTDPLRDDYFRPTHWFVQGRKIHRDRLRTFVSRPVSDLLAPAYAFGGLALSQMMWPYVENWLRTRQSVSDAAYNFSTSVLKTNMGSILEGGAATSLWNRVKLFAQMRGNRGVMVLDKDTEEFGNVSMPLSGLGELQAQAQEHMAAVTGIPLVKLLGITPSGLNASSDGEMRAFYDWIEASQEALFTDHVMWLIQAIQAYLFGDIDPEISWKWEPLWTLNEGELATARKTEADTDIAYIDAGVISPLEARRRLASEEDSPYSSLDVDDLPEPPEQPDEEGGGDFEGGEDAAPDDEKGQWITMNGTHVYVVGGKIVHGPEGLVGKAPDDVGKKPAGPDLSKMPLWKVKAQYRHLYQAEGAAPKAEEAKAKPTPKKPDIKAPDPSREHVPPTAEQAGSIKEYTASAYRPINGALRSGGKPTEEAAKHIAQLDAAMEGASLPEDVTVYRGMTGSAFEQLFGSADKIKANSLLEDHGFLSSSMSEGVARQFSSIDRNGILIKIQTPKGSRAINVSKYSDAPNEREVLFSRDSVLKVVKFDRKAGVLEVKYMGQKEKSTDQVGADAAVSSEQDEDKFTYTSGSGLKLTFVPETEEEARAFWGDDY